MCVHVYKVYRAEEMMYPAHIPLIETQAKPRGTKEL